MPGADPTSPTRRLTWFRTDRRPRAIVLLLHGGQDHSLEPVRYRHASWWRMALVALSLRRFARHRQISVVLLRYRRRGWNDGTDAVADARTTLGELRGRAPGVPIVLVGHSMGGRTACAVGGDDSVAGVCALAPWLPAGESIEPIRGRSLHVIHGTADKWTSPALSREYVERCQSIATSSRWQSVEGVGHFMLRRVGEWNAFVADSVAQILGHSGSQDPISEGTQ